MKKFVTVKIFPSSWLRTMLPGREKLLVQAT